MNCPICNTALARINGRTLKRALRDRRLQHQNIPIKQWVPICPRCDRDRLRSKESTPLPFLASDRVMRTEAEYTDDPSILQPPLEFGRFAFSRAALTNALKLFSEEDAKVVKDTAKTSFAESKAAAFSEARSAIAALELTEAVCDWGRGKRVWANLLRHHDKDQLGIRLRDWLTLAYGCHDPEQAISPGIEIKGLDVSFASKHLRMLVPSRFPVLDAVLSEGLGFALNPKGFALFSSMLAAFQDAHQLGLGVAQLEGGIFLLVRQHVRSSAAPE